MGRWEPDARGRLAGAALELFVERGYDRTTAAEIAERAGLTERTFYRHFVDKREVLFGSAADFQDRLVGHVLDDPDLTRPLDTVCRAFEKADEVFEQVRWPRMRQEVIDQSPELQGRELIKLASLSAALTDALRARDVPDPAAGLAAEAGIAVFKVAFGRWIDQEEADAEDFAVLVRQSLAALRMVTGS